MPFPQQHGVEFPVVCFHKTKEGKGLRSNAPDGKAESAKLFASSPSCRQKAHLGAEAGQLSVQAGWPGMCSPSF